MSIKNLVGEAEVIILGDPTTGAPGLTEEVKAAAFESFKKIVVAVRGLDAIPERLIKVVGALALELVLKYSAGWKLENLALQVLKASPRLLGPHRVVIEEMVYSLQRK